MYAIVEAAGEQIKISSGDTVKVNKINADANTEIVIDRVLMIEDNGKAIWGDPYVKGASVKAEVLGSMKGDKVMVLRTTPKKAHNKIVGHRQQYTTLKIKEITVG
ncbi:MAG: 50S ribosomal protein L21 [Nitrospirae bacterium]|nr:50S ribosomal protein L21 [Nitrospirota bacterium]